MNLRTHSSPSQKSSAKPHSLKNSSNGTVLLEDKFLNNISSKIQGTPVTSYKSRYLENVHKQIKSFPNITKKQDTMVLNFLEIFDDISNHKHLKTPIVKCEKSKDDEICIYRKSMDGISMIAIDEDGDGFYNFTGYKDGIETIFFENENPDIETITYKFFSK